MSMRKIIKTSAQAREEKRVRNDSAISCCPECEKYNYQGTSITNWIDTKIKYSFKCKFCFCEWETGWRKIIR